MLRIETNTIPVHGFPPDGLGAFVGVIHADTGQYDGFVHIVEELDDRPYNFMLVTSANELDALTLTIPEIIDLLKADDPGDHTGSPHGEEFKTLALKACEEGDVDLETHYRAALEAGFNWDAIVADAKANSEEEEGALIGRGFLGSVFALTPSGKVYAAWTTNQTEADVILDEAWRDALEAIAEEKGGFIDSGEGSGSDLFFAIQLDAPDEDDNIYDRVCVSCHEVIGHEGDDCPHCGAEQLLDADDTA